MPSVRILFLFLFLSLAARSFAQSDLEWRAQSFEAPTPDSLARMLTAGIEKEEDRVRVIFKWMTNHISYRLRPRRGGMRDTAWDGLALDERVALQLLREREGVCEDYARLFNTLCRYAGIRSVMVVGYAHNEHDREDRGFSSNHSWNAVWFDSAWHLLDATWAAGYVRPGPDVFQASYEGAYFLADPAAFIRHHYPEDLRWTLLPDPPAIGEFRYNPLRTQAALKYRVRSLAPAGGIVRAAPGDTLRFRIELRPDALAHTIAPGSALEPGPDSLGLKGVFLDPQKAFPARVLDYVWIAAPGVQWLHLRCNEDVILHYRVEWQEMRMR